MVYLETCLVAIASVELEEEVKEELLIPDPETTVAMELFAQHEKTAEHDGRGSNRDDEEGGESGLV
jgi:hypothetical protein